jgi:hypothetical protein
MLDGGIVVDASSRGVVENAQEKGKNSNWHVIEDMEEMMLNSSYTARYGY